MKTIIAYTVSISVTEEGYRYRFTKQHEDSPGIVTPIAFDVHNGLFTRETLAAQTDSNGEKYEGKKVGVSGTISFPEGWGGSK